MLGSPNRKIDLFFRNGVLLYKQLIRPLMYHAIPAWRSVARSNARRLQVLQWKCLFLFTGAHLYVSKRQIHEDQGVALFARHIRALTEIFDSMLSDVGNPYYGKLWDNYTDWGLTLSPDAKAKGGTGSRAVEIIARNGQLRFNETHSALINRGFLG